jgi:hypothetical protein
MNAKDGFLAGEVPLAKLGRGIRREDIQLRRGKKVGREVESRDAGVGPIVLLRFGIIGMRTIYPGLLVPVAIQIYE